MDTLFTVCIVIGFSIPLITLVLGGIFDGLDLLDGNGSLFDFDFDFDMDLGDFCISFLPVSIHSICTGLLVFGVTGKIAEGKLSGWLVVAIAVAVGYFGAILIQSLISTLKRVEHTTHSIDELKDMEAKVINTIIAGGYGSISVTADDGITTSYPAKSENPTQVIRQGSMVTVVSFEKNTAIVKLKEPGTKYHLNASEKE